MKKKLCKLLFFFGLCHVHATAQTTGFMYQAPLVAVDSSGFYNIVLTPQLNAHLKTDYSDLRIANDTGKWIPHLLRLPNEEVTNKPEVLPRQILEKENTIQYTKLIIEAKAEGISNIVLAIKNTAAKRYCTLSGSDDKSNWFVINDSIEIVPAKNIDDNNSSVTLLFPPVNYMYLKIIINNNGKEPLNVISTGTEGINNLPGKMFRYPPVENPATIIFQKDSGRLSYIRIQQSDRYHFEKLAIKVSGAKYYNRFTELYIPTSEKHSFYSPGKLVQILNISNNSTLQFNTILSNAKTFYMVIHNDDNLPLKVEEVKTLFNYRVATAYLDNAKQYSLLMDNNEAHIPGYDIQLEDISNKENLPVVAAGAVVSLQTVAAEIKPKANSKSLIWIIISIAAIVLAFFTYRLVTDMNKQQTN